MNEYEKACKEWMKGCSNAKDGFPEDCIQCTFAFHRRIKQLINDEKKLSD